MPGTAKKFIAESSIIALLQLMLVGGTLTVFTTDVNTLPSPRELLAINSQGALGNSVEIVGFSSEDQKCLESVKVSCEIQVNYDSSIVGDQPVKVNLYASGPDYENKLIETTLIDPKDPNTFDSKATFKPQSPGFYNITAEIYRENGSSAKSFSQRSVLASIDGLSTASVLSTNLDRIANFNLPRPSLDVFTTPNIYNNQPRSRSSYPSANPLPTTQLAVQPAPQAPTDNNTPPNNPSSTPTTTPTTPPLAAGEEIIEEGDNYILVSTKPVVVRGDGVISSSVSVEERPKN